MKNIIEYVFCFLYVSGLFICVYPYLEMKRSKLYICFFLLIYGLVNFVITRDYFLVLHEYMISNILVIVSDFFMICIYERKYLPQLLFYTTLYFCIYSILVNVMTYCYISLGLGILDMYQFSIMRALLVIMYNSVTIYIFKCLEKLKIIPHKNILSINYYIYDIINIIVLISFLIFFGFSLINIDTILIVFIFVVFILLWFCLLLLMNKSFSLIKENNDLLLINMANKNAQSMIKNFKKENESLHKIRHDIKNHLQIIRKMKDISMIYKYVDSIMGDINQIELTNFHTGDETIDTILALKSEQYPHVEFNLNIDIEDMFVELKDFSSIMFNLIDNAVENGSKNKKIVYIKVIQQFSTLVISITNYIDSVPTFKSSKGQNHGYGLKIVKGIVEKYNGSFNIITTEGKVIVEIILEKQ